MVAPVRYNLYVPKSNDKVCPVCLDPISNSKLMAIFKPIVAHSGGGEAHPIHLSCAETAYTYDEQCSSCRVPVEGNFPDPFLKIREVVLIVKFYAIMLTAAACAWFTFRCLNQAATIGMEMNKEEALNVAGNIIGQSITVIGLGVALVGRIKIRELSLKERALSTAMGIAGLAWTYVSYSSKESEIKLTNRIMLAPILGGITWLTAAYGINKMRSYWKEYWSP